MEKEAYIFGRLFILANRVQKLGDQLDDTITVKQWGILATLSQFEEGKASLGEVAAYIGTSGQNVKKMALILEKKGFLEIKARAQDARIVELALTKDALEHAARREAKEELFLAQMYKGIEETELEALCNGLSKLEANLLEMEEGGNQ
ncbi:MAG: MarR family winged helix-turn-helix transcriptional regulator [Cellulosilyticaceae bacterium]